MPVFEKSLYMRLSDDPELFGKPYGARLALVCPNPDDHELLTLGLREATHESKPMIGLDGGEGHSSAMKVGAKVWWVVEPLASDRKYASLCWASGQVELHRVNVEFAGSPSEAVDYLVRTPMHASAAVFGATIHATQRRALAAVGDLGVAIATAGSTHAGEGGVAISLQNQMTACVESYGIAIASVEGIAISGACGQSYTGRGGVSRSRRGGVAVAGEQGRATGTYVVVGEDGLAEVLRGPGGMFAGDVGSQVHADGTTFHAGTDYEPRVAYRVRFAMGRPPQLERCPELDAFADGAALNAGCGLTNDTLVRYFLDARPLCSAAAREHGVGWTESSRSEHGPLQLPEGAWEYLDEVRRP